MEKPKILCVVGPTASGKTAYAIELCKKRGGEVVSCDSMQIYRGMNIGTAKPTQEEMQGIPHYMIDICDPKDTYSVADYVQDASACIADILSRGKLPVLCGGTGLYMDSLCGGITFAEEAKDDAYREELKNLAEREGNDAVHRLLQKTDPDAAAEIHPNNVKRVIRALEINRTTGLHKSEFDRKARRERSYDAEYIGLCPAREVLYDRINRRVDKMMENGLPKEVERLLCEGVPRTATSMQAIGYKELVAYIDGETSLAEAVDTIKQETRRYAKRQMTWWRRNQAIYWVL